MDKKLLIAIGLSVLTVWLFNYFINKDNKTIDNTNTCVVPSQVQPGASYKVPTAQQLAQPLETEIDFYDKKINQPEQIKVVETDLYKIAFSNYGAVVSTIDFKKYLGKNSVPLRTIHNKGFYLREEASFILALDEKTPYFYKLIDFVQDDKEIKLTYLSEVENWIFKKQFILYKSNYKIDLILSFEPKDTNNQTELQTKVQSESDANFQTEQIINSLKPRLFFAAPFVGEIGTDSATGICVTPDGKNINKISKIESNQAWIAVSVFGAEDKYFVNALVSDPKNFTQRAYFKETKNNLFSILEGPQIKEKSSWNLSFYVGPKSVDDLLIVDSRLEDLLSFGWLSWLCKLFLSLLKFLFSFLNNYGLAIIVLTIILKIPFTPLTIMGRKKMEEYQKYQPALNRIRLKYKTDIKKQQEEIVKFHRDHNLSPAAPMVGCLPFLIQMPILFALYRVLNGYIDLYQAPFFGWITDLSAKDPYYVLPILMGASMLWQQMMTPATDPKQKVMFMFMPLIMTAVFANFPSGLVLYWFINNLLMIAEDYARKAFFK